MVIDCLHPRAALDWLRDPKKTTQKKCLDKFEDVDQCIFA